MQESRTTRAVLLLALTLACAPAGAQIPEKFTNLQVIPKDISRRDLVSTMRGWASALGVHCDGCHAGGNPNTLQGVDFASDAKWEKRTARAMLRMVAAINDDHVARLEPRPTTGGEPAPAGLRVECMTCHRGLKRPETIDGLVGRVLAKDGADAAVRTYNDLRSQYLVSGKYDFGSGPLNGLGERLLDEGRAREALALLELNAGNNPSAPWTLFLLGEARLAAGDRAGAAQAFERSLALDPENPRTRKRVEELKAAPPAKP